MDVNGWNMVVAAGLGTLVGVLIYAWGSWMDRRRAARLEADGLDKEFPNG